MGNIRVLLKLLGFWIVFFAIQQLCFIAVNFSSYSGKTFDLLLSFIVALPMHISASMYILSIPILAFIAGLFGFKHQIISHIIKWETTFFIIVCSFIGASDIGLYKVWGTKINAKALSYLIYPEEVIPTLFAIQNLGLLFMTAAQITIGIWLYKKCGITYETQPAKWHIHAIVTICSLAFCIIGIRGGVQKIPINRNWVFKSEYSLLNYGSLNGFWNAADLVFHPLEKQENPYLFVDYKNALAITANMHSPIKGIQDSTLSILSTKKPNVVIIFLESWASDVIGCLEGEKNVTPKFNSLSKDGLLFTNFYASGYRTEQGYLATLSATPALPVGSVIQSFGKFDKLPNLYRSFNQLGYHTSFYTGGRLFFDNIEAYLRAAGVQTMKGENEWTINKRTVWGAYDEETFAMHLTELAQMQQPFFSAVASMTTHEWFDANVPQIFTGDNDIVNDNYRNTMHYADSCLYAYITIAKTQPWYANTLFIIMADHSCNFPKKRNNFEQERYHIPLLLLGGALQQKWVGQKMTQVSSQTDIAATLLAQLNQKSTEFPYSKDVLNKAYPLFAYYAFDNGFGLITDTATIIYDHNRKEVISGNQTSILAEKGKAFLEVQFQENLDYATQKRNSFK